MFEQDRDYLLPKPPESRRANGSGLSRQVAAVINAAQSREEIEQTLLELIMDLIPAERVAILLSDGDPNQLTTLFSSHNGRRPHTAAEPARTVISRVLRDGSPFLAVNRNGGSPPLVPALAGSPIRSILAVPLVAFERIRGVMYLDTTNPDAVFKQSHIQPLMTLGSIVIVALEHAHRREPPNEPAHRFSAGLNGGATPPGQHAFRTTYVGVSDEPGARSASRPESWRSSSGDAVRDVEHTLAGTSSSMRRVRQLIARVAPTDSTILISGESGTGKELAACAIHRSSRRAAAPFVAINCAVLTETLLESELFGHEKGAFTGAHTRNKGKFELADGGTIFLDEIGALAPSLQAKLLRVLEERQFERVGGTQLIKIDVRLIAAANTDLENAVGQGIFRIDLYFRLKVISLTMPPLREHREDIALLVSQFAGEFSERYGRRVAGISPEAQSVLMDHTWPGNVRELRNAVEHAVVIGASDVIGPGDLPLALLRQSESIHTPSLKYREASEEARKQIIVNAFIQAGGSYSRAARVLNINPTYLSRLVRKMSLKNTLDGMSGAQLQ